MIKIISYLSDIRRILWSFSFTEILYKTEYVYGIKNIQTVLLFCLTGGSAGGLLAKPTELIVVPMTTGLGVNKKKFPRITSGKEKEKLQIFKLQSIC